MILFFLLSCGDENNKTSKPETEKTSANVEPIACYQYASANDTISLKLIYVGSSITGTLVYKLHEKDKNMGTIQGSMKGNILIADYTFMSEGVQSVRQVAFKKEGDQMTEGYGDVTETNGKTVFRNEDSLQFNDKFSLSAINCK
jgi:hypothetical protein